MKDTTKFTHMGRPKPGLGTPVNHDITRASTLLFEKAEDLYRTDVRGYGRHGSQVHDAVEDAFNTLENGAGTSLTPSGLAACTLAILSCVKSGDHVLVTDSIYGPTRAFCDHFLRKMNIECERFDPNIGSNIKTLLRNNTSAILLESPGSLTFEIQDLPAIANVAKDAVIIVDNTWSGGITYKALDLGADISVHAATKYVGGHSDIMFGAVISRTEKMAKQVSNTRKLLGFATSPDDAYQILRGFRTLHTRFRAQEASALELANWLATQDFVDHVLHPGLPSHPDHALWKRDFTGGGCLFSIVAKPASEQAVLNFMNTLTLYGIGFSYGGFESVAIHCDPQLNRNHAPKLTGPLIRFGCGLEDIDDLKNDIKQAAAVAF